MKKFLLDIHTRMSYIWFNKKIIANYTDYSKSLLPVIDILWPQMLRSSQPNIYSALMKRGRQNCSIRERCCTEELPPSVFNSLMCTDVLVISLWRRPQQSVEATLITENGGSGIRISRKGMYESIERNDSRIPPKLP